MSCCMSSPPAKSVRSMAYRAGVPGLNKALTVEDLEKSRNMYSITISMELSIPVTNLPSYNQLLDDSQQPEIHEYIHDLATIFARNRAYTVFGIHLAHAHFTLPDKKVLVGVNHETPRCRWANATTFKAINLDNVHGHIFVLTNDGFHPYEYQAGPAPALSQVDVAFLVELAEFLRRNKLETLIGLQIIDPHPSQMLELVLPQGTVMLDVSNVNGCVPTRQTGWKFEVENGELRGCKANESHAQNGTEHKVFNEGAPYPKMETLQDLKNVLAKAGILSVA